MDAHIRKMQNVLDDLVQPLSPPRSKEKAADAVVHHALRSSLGDNNTESQWLQTVIQESVSTPIRGPTSPTFTLDVVKRRFKERGFDSDLTPRFARSDDTRLASSHVNFGASLKFSPALRNVLKDSLWEIPGVETLRLLRFFASGSTALMYPFIETTEMIAEAQELYKTVDAIRLNEKYDKIDAGIEHLLRYDLTTLKLIVAIAIVSEKGSSDRFADRLLQSAQDELWEIAWRESSLEALSKILLLAIYHFHIDEESAAGRLTAVGARMCVELGLNRQQNINSSFPTFQERRRATMCFWSAYTLDRRGSIGVGLPYILQDAEIDTEAPQSSFNLAVSSNMGAGVTDSERVREASKQYLIAMIKFTQLSGKACASLHKAGDRSDNVPYQDFESLDYQVLQWQRSIPDGLKLQTSELEMVQSIGTNDKSGLFLRVVLSARMNQLRNLIFRPVLYRPVRISQRPDQARTAVEVAKESIHLLWKVNEMTDIVRLHPIFFKHFLVSAFGLLLLAMVNAWSDLGQQVTHEFRLALDLFKVMSVQSPLVKRYATTIDGLEELAHKIGLPRFAALENQTTHSSRLSAPRNVPSACERAEAANSTNTTCNALERDGLGDWEMNSIDIRDEFATFLDLDAGQTSSFFDFPLADMFWLDAPQSEN